MRLPLTIGIMFIANICFAQNAQVDSLIQKLNNSQIGFGGDYAGATIHLEGEPAIQLYKIGKPATEKLVAILEDSTKGIVAHIILSWIWDMRERPKTILIERDGIAVYTYNKLNFFLNYGNKNRKDIYSNQHDLMLNKLEWKTFLRSH